MTQTRVVRNGKLRNPDLREFIVTGADKLSSVVTVKADCRNDAIDLLFVVKGDLFEAEREVVGLMRQLRKAFPERYFDVMVLPIDRYTSSFHWGSSPRTLFLRKA